MDFTIVVCYRVVKVHANTSFLFSWEITAFLREQKPTMKRILSGNRPTGKLHWGNYFGALKNWLELQEKYECYFFIADWHALTTAYEDSQNISADVVEVLKDWLACGLDPKKSTLFIQSWVPEHAELHLLLSMLTPLGWLQRVPSYKDMQEELQGKDLNTYGFLGYPLLQTADIALYNTDLVPVGEDQVAHVELSREIVRRFHFVTKSKDVLKEPKELLTKTARIPGMDRRKMSKSFGNAIYIADDDATISKKVMKTLTDPARKRREDPGNPDVCTVFDYHKLFTKENDRAKIYQQCSTAAIGCVDCKKICAGNAQKFWQPIREKRESFNGKEAELMEIVKEGSSQARNIAKAQMDDVRIAMGLNYESTNTST